MHALVYHNDRVLPAADGRLSPGQGGLFSGWGVFTTLRLYRGAPFAFERHWRRLARDAALLDVSLPVTESELRAALDEVARRNGVGEGSARIYLVRNRVGHWDGPGSDRATDVLIATADLPPVREPAALAVREHGLRSDHPLAGVKMLAWLPNAWLRAQAAAGGFDEVILLNERGEVAECTSANLFRVKDGVVETPPLASGCLDGVTREVLLELGRAGDPAVVERVLRLPDVLAADEVFITSTSRELLAVGRIEGRRLAGPGGPVTRRLAARFADHVAQHIPAARS